MTRGGLVPAAIVARELGIRLVETVCVASYHDYQSQGSLKVLKAVSQDVIDLSGGEGAGGACGGRSGRYRQERRALSARCCQRPITPTLYAKPLGRPLVDTFITEVSQDTWIYFPWDTALSFQPPIRDGAA